MKKVIILNTVDDANHCLREGMHKDAILFSTHSGVDIYLKELHGVDCRCISTFFTTKEMLYYKGTSAKTIDDLVDDLDKNVTPSINEFKNFGIQYFKPLYSFFGKYQFLGYVCFFEALKRIVQSYNPPEIHCYNYKFANFFKTNSDMYSFRDAAASELSINVLNSKESNSPKNATLKKLLYRAKRAIQQPTLLSEKITDAIKIQLRYKKFSSGRKTILLYEYLYDLEFLKDELNKNYNILYYIFDGMAPVGYSVDKKSIVPVDIDFKDFDFIKERDNPCVKLFLDDIRHDFLRNVPSYLCGLRKLEDILRESRISAGIWGNSPVVGLKALAFEYLNSEGITIIGGQHGNLYGDSLMPEQYDSDYSRCDHFITYGFTHEDLKRGYPDLPVSAKIVPMGKEQRNCNPRKRKMIDILFPITNSFSIFRGGMGRISPHQLTERQTKLLEYLDSLESVSVYIKPFPNATYNSCSVLPILKRLKNCTIVRSIPLINFLDQYQQRIVLF